MLGKFFVFFGGKEKIFNGIGSAFDFEHGGVIKKSGEAFGVEGGRAYDELEIGAFG